MDKDVTLTAIQIYANACSNGKEPLYTLKDFITSFNYDFKNQDIKHLESLVKIVNGIF